MEWLKSTYTGGHGNCVEVADDAATVMVRDTKDRNGGTLAFDSTAWERFAASLRYQDQREQAPPANVQGGQLSSTRRPVSNAETESPII